MSGTICKIIADGNVTQALSHSIKQAATGLLPEANMAVANALTLCQLGTTSYDGKEVMTDDQQSQAVEIMEAFNDAAGQINCSRMLNHTEQQTAKALLARFNADANALKAAVIGNG